MNILEYEFTVRDIRDAHALLEPARSETRPIRGDSNCVDLNHA